MKMKFTHGILTAALLGFATAAVALPTPPVLPAGPLYIKYDNLEQISATNSILSGGIPEGNWGIFKVSTMSTGDTTHDPYLFDPAVQFWSQASGGEITGIFYGLTVTSTTPFLDSTGGFLDIYFDSTPDASLGAATPAQRTGLSTFTNFTDGILLAHLTLASGIDPGNPLVFTRGNVVPSSTGFVGIADSYANVDPTMGLWGGILDGNYFPTAFGPRDIRLRSIYNGPIASWNGGGDIFGAQSSDPVRAFAVPEPGSLMLFGLGALVLAMFSRRRRS